MDGLWFSETILVLLAVFTCSQAKGSSVPDFELPSQCRVPANSTLWWSPLVPNFAADPCQLHQNLKTFKVVTTCCFGNQIVQVGADNCGPCSADMYNLVIACMTCVDKDISLFSTPPVVNNDTQIHLDNTQPLQLPTFSQFQLGTRKLDHYPIALPSWVNAPLNDDLFDPQGVVNFANAAAVSTTPSVNSAGNISSTPTPTSDIPDSNSPESSTFSLPVAPSTSNSSSNSSPTISVPSTTVSHAGAIAGGIVGGFLALILIVLGGVLIRRRRRMARMPPSARFIAVTGPGIGYTMSRDEEAPPPFTSGDWRDPVTEKVETTTDMQRQYDAGMYRSY